MIIEHLQALQEHVRLTIQRARDNGDESLSVPGIGLITHLDHAIDLCRKNPTLVEKLPPFTG